ncbi:MAG: hypothetical protein JW841_03510 [Deltaproteobacteria bacterium]|nr:hypothetical protein [Deltaproteobacteria bacterium]
MAEPMNVTTLRWYIQELNDTPDKKISLKPENLTPELKQIVENATGKKLEDGTSVEFTCKQFSDWVTDKIAVENWGGDYRMLSPDKLPAGLTGLSPEQVLDGTFAIINRINNGVPTTITADQFNAGSDPAVVIFAKTAEGFDMKPENAAKFVDQFNANTTPESVSFKDEKGTKGQNWQQAKELYATNYELYVALDKNQIPGVSAEMSAALKTELQQRLVNEAAKDIISFASNKDNLSILAIMIKNRINQYSLKSEDVKAAVSSLKPGNADVILKGIENSKNAKQGAANSKGNIASISNGGTIVKFDTHGGHITGFHKGGSNMLAESSSEPMNFGGTFALSSDDFPYATAFTQANYSCIVLDNKIIMKSPVDPESEQSLTKEFTVDQNGIFTAKCYTTNHSKENKTFSPEAMIRLPLSGFVSWKNDEGGSYVDQVKENETQQLEVGNKDGFGFLNATKQAELQKPDNKGGNFYSRYLDIGGEVAFSFKGNTLKVKAVDLKGMTVEQMKKEHKYDLKLYADPRTNYMEFKQRGNEVTLKPGETTENPLTVTWTSVKGTLSEDNPKF